MKFFFSASIIAVIALACNGDTDSEAKSNLISSTSTKTKTSSSTSTKIRNDIQLQSKGLKVSQAFLVYDDGRLVPEDNATNVGQPVNLRLIIEDGWKQKDGKVFVGASERIESSEGDLLLDEKDLFQNITSVRPEDAQYITLTATVSKLNKLYDYFLVSFRVWDKNGSGEVTGNFKLRIQ
ncbi:MAG TPA: hypothetical protein VD794_00220 [Flavisolibacter sp.]|nr:hypothetical protein [Flavisolibacter sp.]